MELRQNYPETLSGSKVKITKKRTGSNLCSGERCVLNSSYLYETYHISLASSDSSRHAVLRSQPK